MPTFIFSSIDTSFISLDHRDMGLNKSKSYGSTGNNTNTTDMSDDESSSSSLFCSNHAEADDKIVYSSISVIHDVTILPVADEHGHLSHYPGEEEHWYDVHKKLTMHPLLGSALEAFKCCFSMALLLVSMYVCVAAIMTQQTKYTADMSASNRGIFIAFFWFLILWLAEMEGSQSCLVGLQPIDKALFRHTHPCTYKTTQLAHLGDNMERFITGRQFLIVLVVFVTNMMTFPVHGVSIAGVNDNLTNVLLGSGIAPTAVAVMLGQVAQINAANCMVRIRGGLLLECRTIDPQAFPLTLLFPFAARFRQHILRLVHYVRVVVFRRNWTPAYGLSGADYVCQGCWYSY